jgi:hypothetical protein
MDAATFLRRILPDTQDGFFSVHFMDHTKPKGQGFWGRAFKDKNEIEKWAKWASQRNMCAYYAMASYKTASVRQQANGPASYTPTRTAVNAAAMKALWMDIDIGKPGAYETINLAVNAVAEFVKDTGVPKPTIMVGSGSGLHVYWTLTKTITPTDWALLANALKNAASTYGLLQDPTRTADPASVLRVPDTLNWKSKEHPKQVKVLGARPEDYTPEQMRDALSPYMVATRPAGPALLPGFGDLTAGLGGAAKPVDLTLVLPECEVLRVAAETGGEAYEEPLWYQTLRAASYTDKGREWAHTMSKGHPKYDPGETDKKYDQAVVAKEQNDLGWPRCSQFAQHRSTVCAKCPHFSEGKSPLNFRKGETNDLPPPYLRHPPTGLIYVPLAAKGDDETEQRTTVPILDYPLYDAQLVMSEGKQAIRFTAHIRRNTAVHPVAVTVPLERLGDAKQLVALLNGQGLIVSAAYRERIGEFLMAWTKKLQRASDLTTNPAFGWAREGGKTLGFSFAGACHSGKDELPVMETDAALKDGYTPHGALAAWRKASEYISTQGRPQLDVMLATAFAAPLVEFTDEMGMVMSFISPGSGTGKTSGMRTAQAVWGDPHSEMNALNDTSASVAHKLGALRNLPLFWDELRGDEDSLKFTQLVFNVTQGKDKSRMTATIERRQVGTWNTMMIVASNQSIFERMKDGAPEGPAGQYRVFEIVVPPIPQGVRSFADFGTVVGKVRNNFGHAGLVYAKYLGENHEKVRDAVKRMAEQIIVKVKADNPERFWVYSMATIIVGAQLSRELDLTDINVPAMAKYLLDEAFPAMREQVSMDASPVQTGDTAGLLVDFVRSLQPDRYIETDTLPRPGHKDSVVILSNEKLLRRVDAHLVTDTGQLRISRKAFLEYLKSQGAYRRGVSQELEAALGALKSNTYLAPGTPFRSNSKENVWLLDTNHPQLGALK